jgi:hypothetical protein
MQMPPIQILVGHPSDVIAVCLRMQVKASWRLTIMLMLCPLSLMARRSFSEPHTYDRAMNFVFPLSWVEIYWCLSVDSQVILRWLLRADFAFIEGLLVRRWNHFDCLLAAVVKRNKASKGWDGRHLVLIFTYERFCLLVEQCWLRGGVVKWSTPLRLRYWIVEQYGRAENRVVITSFWLSSSTTRRDKLCARQLSFSDQCWQTWQKSK